MKPKDVSNHIRNKFGIFLVPSTLDRLREYGILDVENNDKGQYDYTDKNLKNLERYIMLQRLYFKNKEIMKWFKGNQLVREEAKRRVHDFRDKIVPNMLDMVGE